MVYVIADIELFPDKKNHYLDELRKAIPLVRNEDGCLEYNPSLDFSTGIPIQKPPLANVVTIMERWRDVDALMAHLGTVHMQAFFQAVAPFVKETTIRVLKPQPI